MIVKITLVRSVRLLIIFFTLLCDIKLHEYKRNWLENLAQTYIQYNGPRKYKDIANFSSFCGQYTSSPIVPVNTMVWFSTRKSIVSLRCLFAANGLCVHYESSIGGIRCKSRPGLPQLRLILEQYASARSWSRIRGGMGPAKYARWPDVCSIFELGVWNYFRKTKNVSDFFATVRLRVVFFFKR